MTCLATTAYVHEVYAVCVTIFSTNSKFGAVSDFTDLLALTRATYALSRQLHIL